MQRILAWGFVFFVCLPSSAGTSCEPAGPLAVSATVIGREDLGSRERVLIDLEIQSLVAGAESVRITGAAESATGKVEARERLLSLSAGAHRKVRYALDLEKGRVHHVRFVVGSVDEPSVVSSAYVRVNLDPSLEPQIIDGVLQYRARMEGR